MALTGRILQFIGVTVIVLGVIAGVMAMAATPSAYSYAAGNAAGTIIIGSALSGLLLIGIGGAFVALDDIATRHTPRRRFPRHPGTASDRRRDIAADRLEDHSPHQIREQRETSLTPLTP